ncbi:MAG: hypothetical protein ACM3PE_00385 [Deltaproteobacteria bacterium]
MAHWLYCQSCQQWNRSVTPLSEDKVCSFCGSTLKKTKGGSGSASVVNAEKAEELMIPASAQTPEVTEAPQADAAAEEEATVAADEPAEKAVEEEAEETEDPVDDEASPPAEDAEEEDDGEDDGEDEPAAEEEESSTENDVVKVSEVRVITDKNEKKERLAKKRH